MPASAADLAAIDAVRAALQDAAIRLAAQGARTEALAEYVPARRVLLVPRGERLRSAGRVWRLGVLLLAADAQREAAASVTGPRVYATGSVTRSHEPGRPTYQALSAERRRQLRVAAYRGHFEPGESVNFGARAIAIDETLVGASGPLFVADGRALVRWSSATDAVTDFAGYLADRVSLLAEPPSGA